MTDKKVSIKAIKIGLLGNSQVGKTAISRSFLNYEFDSDIISTIGFMKFETKYKLKDENIIKLILWGTAGQERFSFIGS